MNILISTLLLLSLGGTSSPCPPADPDTANFIKLVLQESERIRTDIGASPNEHETVEILTDSTTCGYITTMAGVQGLNLTPPDSRYRYVFIKSQNYYYLVGQFTPTPQDDKLHLGLLPLVIMNKQFVILTADLS